MGLTAYKKKRDFKRTPEPAGKVGRRHEKGLRYLIQKHDASRLHYDFRLELDGTLKSWAVPKGPSLDPERKALAVQVEDHPLDYGDFEGVIPKGQYGGGTVLLWDKGTWEPLEDPHEAFKRRKLRFELHGEKLHGEWSLVQMHGTAGAGGKNWLLIKMRDSFSGSKDILSEARSVKTRRSMEEIAGERDDVWDSEAKSAAKVSGAHKSAMPASIVPQLAVLAEHPPQGDQWLHEMKFDGYRLLAFIKEGEVTLRTRTGKDWTHKFLPLAKALGKLKVDSAILDGEAVVLNAKGQSDFQALQQMFKSEKKVNLQYYAFDLLYFYAVDLRESPLLERKRLLKELLEKGAALPTINYSDHVLGDGEAVIEKACALGSEGIVSKRADAPYVSRRDASWLKSKCTQRQEFVIIGYTRSIKRSEGLRSLLLGYHDAKKQLVYSGRAGTGFDHRMLVDLLKKLEGLRRESTPTATLPPVRERRAACWVKPELVCEVRFTGWTQEGVLRHPVFMGLRLDKPAGEVKREVPVETQDVEANRAADGGSDNGHKRDAGGTKKRPVTKSTAALSERATSAGGVELSHPDKVLYPQEKLTKADLAAYYEFVQAFMLPHVMDRPLALVRCPAGLASKCFFMRNWSETLPKAVDKVNVGGSKKERHVMIHDLQGLLSLVQISALEVHTWNCKAVDIEHPDQVIFDLDPGPGVEWKQVVEAAQSMRKLLKSLRLPAFLKTSGGKGLHLTVPILPTVNWDQAKSFCKTLAEYQASRSDGFVTNMRKDLRGGKIYIDYLRNGRGATAVAPYGARARAEAGVSMPIAWEECGRLKSAAQFTLANARRYLEKRKVDPWRDFGAARVDLAAVTLADKSGN